jgi:putative cell wall-binding protein
MTSCRKIPRTLKALMAFALPIGVLTGVGGALVLSGTAGATTTPGVLHVAPGGVTSGSCTTTAHPCATLGYALSQAAASNTIQLAAGTYKASANPAHTSNTLTAAVAVEGVTGHPTEAIITATGQEFGLIVQASTSLVEDLTVENAGRSGVLVSPATTAAKPATVATVAILANDIVTNDKCATTPTFHTSAATTICKTPTPESDYGEGLHLLSVSDSEISTNDVSKNWGGILVTDELGPNHTNVIATNQANTNPGDCGITLAGHNPTAVHTTGPTTGKPDPAAAGVYGNTIAHNTADNNGGAGLLAATPFPGTGVYTNTFVTNTANGNGLPGMTIHSHAPLQDTRGNKVVNNTFMDDALHGGPTGKGGPGTGTAGITATTGVEVLAAVGPTDVSGTTVTGNTISSVFYGVWLSPGVQDVATIHNNTITVSAGGTPVFSEPARIFGKTADATAAVELATQFTPTADACPGTGAVVLSRDNYYSDALASQYLAASLTTGTLLTPTGSLSTATKTAIKDEGISHVYIVGGPLAVSTSVENAIKALAAYECGGKTQTGKTVQVTRIAGQTEYATAQTIATDVGSLFVGHADVAAAYAGTNATGGTGAFNDTKGNGSASAASGTLRTAILATGQGFQDAESASVIAYAEHFPILLTTPGTLSSQAATAIKKLTIKQVVVMGGPFAVSDGVVTQLEALGVSVLRVAGADYTDTAVQVADFEMSSVGLHWTPVAEVIAARGDFYSDGLAGAVVAAGAGHSNVHSPEPLLLTENPTTVGSYLKSFLATAGSSTGIANDDQKVSSLTILGGTLAVTTATANAMESDLAG